MRYEIYTEEGDELVARTDSLDAYRAHGAKYQVIDTTTGEVTMLVSNLPAPIPHKIPFERVGVFVRVHPDDKPAILAAANNLNQMRMPQ